MKGYAHVCVMLLALSLEDSSNHLGITPEYHKRLSLPDLDGADGPSVMADLKGAFEHWDNFLASVTRCPRQRGRSQKSNSWLEKA
jgi:hypothetical protein